MRKMDRGSPDGSADFDHVWHLEQCPLFAGISRQILHSLRKILEQRLYDKGEVIYRAGSASDHLFLLNRGVVTVSLQRPSGREKILSILTTGRLFGEEALTPGISRQAWAKAHEESWVSVIHRRALAELMAAVPEIRLNMVQVLNAKLREARRDIEGLSLMDTRSRLAGILVKLAQDLGHRVFARDGMKKLKVVLCHQDLARLAGGNRPHVSTVLSEFRKQGFIDYENKKLLVHVERLAALTGEPARDGYSRSSDRHPRASRAALGVYASDARPSDTGRRRY